MSLLHELETLTGALDAHGLPYALCGGLALAVYARPRATQDIDLLVPDSSVDDVANVARDECGYALDNGILPFPSSGMRIRRVTKILDTGLLPLDLLYVTPALRDVWDERVRAQWMGRELTVVSHSGLVRMKRLAARPQDMADIAALEDGG